MGYMKSLLVLLFPFIMFSQTNSDVYSYYKEITSGSEFGGSGGSFKFYNDVYIFIEGDYSDSLYLELLTIVSELNDLIDPIQFYITDKKDSSNIQIYCGDSKTYVKKYTFSKSKIVNAWGLAFMFTKNDTIELSLVFIDTKRNLDENQRKDILREELTQSLGFGQDSYLYPNSVFYQGWTEIHHYADIDKEIIKLHYNK